MVLILDQSSFIVTSKLCSQYLLITGITFLIFIFQGHCNVSVSQGKKLNPLTSVSLDQMLCDSLLQQHILVSD